MLTNGDCMSIINDLNERKIEMTGIIDLTNEKDITSLTSIELMNLHRQHIRERRIRKGSIICGRILNTAPDTDLSRAVMARRKCVSSLGNRLPRIQRDPRPFGS